MHLKFPRYMCINLKRILLLAGGSSASKIRKMNWKFVFKAVLLMTICCLNNGLFTFSLFLYLHLNYFQQHISKKTEHSIEFQLIVFASHLEKSYLLPFFVISAY